MAEFLRLADGRIGKNAGLDAIGLEGRNHGLHAPDLHDGDIFFGHESEMAQRDARTNVNGSSETGNAQSLAA